MTNKNKTVLYVGVTSALKSRVKQHKEHFHKGSFTDKYNCEYLVYYEEIEGIENAIKREKQMQPAICIRKSITTENPFEINRFTVFPSITVLASTLISRKT